jgi:uncharacterized RDD family membrane protein YckC
MRKNMITTSMATTITPTTNAAPGPASPTASGPYGGHQLAGRGTRLSAAGLDGSLVMLACVPALVDMTKTIVRTYIEQERLDLKFSMSAGIALSGVLLFALCVITAVLVARNGQTIGKKLLGIRVVRSNGAPAGLGRIFWLRNVAASAPSLLQLGSSGLALAGFVYSLVDELMIFGDTRQCLLDRIADTIVVRA